MLEKEYWQNLQYPLAPSIENVETFKKYKEDGTCLLLGCTKNLIQLSDVQMDTMPWYEAPSVIIQDWRTNTTFYNNIIGDGVMVFEKELSDSILEMASKYCNVLIIRSFNYKLPTMRIAKYFPTENDFAIYPTVVEKYKDYSFYVWNFKRRV